jgi:NAD(P)-dependent dehydrogenase (short-subunit alcohol dehydrogenase family)
MAKIFVTGSADGLGKLAAQKLIAQGHHVWLHARNAKRAADVRQEVPKAKDIIVGDFADMAQVRSVAGAVNKLGSLDAILHNAAIYQEPKRNVTKDGIANLFMINSLAPYMLTGLIAKPKRLIYMSSGLHKSADFETEDYEFKNRTWSAMEAYSESKFQDVLLAFYIARKFPAINSNALEPGWVPTKMGGASAPDDLGQGADTQVWLATSDDIEAKVTGDYFYHKKLRAVAPAARDPRIQDRFVAYCEKISGVKL